MKKPIPLGPGMKLPFTGGKNFSWSRTRQAQFDRELAQARRVQDKVKKPFNVVELGGGKVPLGLVKLASKRRGINARRRKFVGNDIHLDMNTLLEKSGLKKLPRNLSFINKCAVQALEGMESGTAHVIFASYLFNTMRDKKSGGREYVPIPFDLTREAKRVLVPGGRLVFVNNLGHKHIFRDLAAQAGLGFHAIPLTDTRAQNSAAYFIRERGTPEGRKKRIATYMMREDPESILASIFVARMNGHINKFDEYARPTIYLLRKPRAGEKKIIPVGEHTESLDPHLLHPAEEKLLENMLRDERLRRRG